MSDINDFLSSMSKRDWASSQIPVTMQNKKDLAMPYILNNSSKVTYEILREYHQWLTSNYDIKSKD